MLFLAITIPSACSYVPQRTLCVLVLSAKTF